jgi:hypothetical protein
MKRAISKFGQQFKRMMTAFVLVLLLQLPASTSLVCIAPGGHIAIESIGDTCCKSFESSIPIEAQSSRGLNMAGDCHNCTDFFITSHILMAASESHGHAKASLVAVARSQNSDSTNVSPALCRLAGSFNNDKPVLISSAVPMRC